MSAEEYKNKVLNLYKTNPKIHINLNTGRKKLKHTPCIITGVYTHLFTVESNINGYMENFTIKYVDLLTKELEILELN